MPPEGVAHLDPLVQGHDLEQGEERGEHAAEAGLTLRQVREVLVLADEPVPPNPHAVGEHFPDGQVDGLLQAS